MTFSHTNHQTQLSLPVSHTRCLHFPWSCPAAESIFMSLETRMLPWPHFTIYRMRCLPHCSHQEVTQRQRRCGETMTWKWGQLNDTVPQRQHTTEALSEWWEMLVSAWKNAWRLVGWSVFKSTPTATGNRSWCEQTGKSSHWALFVGCALAK